MITFALLVAVLVTSQETPVPADVGCGDPGRTDIVCPDDPEVASIIVSVTATDDGVSILLTDEGVSSGRTCDGAARIVTMASDLYGQIPANRRLRDDLLWANPVITREVFAHAWGASVGIDNGNPVDIVFADYAGESSTLQGRIWGGPLNVVIPC